MSSDNDEADDVLKMMSCASCGVAEVDEIKLKECTNCDLVRYCSVACQRDHISKHLRDCKKRAAELRDEQLFKQPESTYLGDCPICMMPLQLDLSKSTLQTCCSKVICNGCAHANYLREEEGMLQKICPFCRKPIPDTAEECKQQMMKRVEANDPVAMTQWGSKQYDNGDYSSAFEWYTKAAELGYAEAHSQLSILYHLGHGVEKHEGKEIHHREEAAIGGHPDARYILGCDEGKNGNTEKAVKHWIIAATQGDNDSIKTLMDEFRSGTVSKDDLAAALRAHQAAVDATKSPQREAAERNYRK
eukprot:scaffold22810_cov103-Skeletonema_dohrnii-CCMP3373.AAC.2